MKQKKLIEDDEDNLKDILGSDMLDDEDGDDDEYAEDASQAEIDPNLDFRSLQRVTAHDNEDYLYSSKLNNLIDDIFQRSRWTVISPNKKIPKDLIPLIFQDILKELENTEFTMVEKFVTICDYTAINYLKAYESIHMKYKEMIVQEIDKKFHILNKKGIKKIF